MTDFSGKMVYNLFYFQIKIKLSIKSEIITYKFMEYIILKISFV